MLSLPRRATYADYLAAEQTSESRLELIDGVIVAMSMPDPPKAHPGSKEQKGRKPGALGILLPGFWIEGNTLRGAAVPHGLPLPEGFKLDEEGFVFISRLTEAG